MKRVATAAMAGLVVLLASLVGFAPAQAASCSVPEGDSGDPLVVRVCLDGKTVDEKTQFSVHATVESNKPGFHCLTLKYKYEGKENTSGTFTAPSVSHDTATTIRATCYFDDATALGGGGTGRLSTSVVTAVVGQPATATIFVLNKGNGNGNGHHHHKKHHKKHHGNGHLPNTGGERLAWLVIGLLLVAAGTTVVVSSRKRDSVA